MNIFTRWLRSCARIIGAATLVVGGLLLGAPPVSAQGSCIQDVWMAHGNTQGLTCTANDVSLSSVANICIVVPFGGANDQNPKDGCQDPNPQGQLTCISGQQFTFTADFTMPLTAQARYDLGLYISTDGGGADGALTGLCAPNVVTAANSVPFSNFINKDLSPPDFCGDIDDTHNPQVIRQTIPTTCSDTNGDGKVNLPWCTTWRQPGANEVCDSTTFTSASDFDAYPGSPSKCNCGDLNIDVFLETASITVVKDAVTPTVLETGGSVTYSVSVTNNAQVSDVALDSLVDNLYGDITTTGHNGITATTCTLATIPAESNDPGGLNPYLCQFTVTVGPGDAGDKITDIVTACGTDDFGHSNLCDDDPADVTYVDVSTPPSLAKTAIAPPVAVAVDVQYTVAVNNNSTVDTLTLNTLNDDKFGNITQVQGNVLSTDCTVPQTIAAGSSYTCSFVGRITATGSHHNVASATATDDDGVNYPVPPATLDDFADVTITVTFP